MVVTCYLSLLGPLSLTEIAHCLRTNLTPSLDIFACVGTAEMHKLEHCGGEMSREWQKAIDRLCGGLATVFRTKTR